jgi:ribonuclease BN (tRNA processing enzyme)
MEARLLGSGGWMPNGVRETTCVYARDADEVLVIDAGTGLRRLFTEPRLVDGVRRLSLVLTHFHLDHIVGLPLLFDLDQVAEREIWGAGEATVGTPTESLVHRLLDPPFLPWTELPATVHELAPPGARIGRFDVAVRVQVHHHHPTLAVRVNGSLAFCTDTSYDAENVDFVRGATVLCHDAWGAADAAESFGHTASGEAARLAAAADVSRLVLVHLHPEQDDEELLRFARPHFAATEAGRDGLVLLAPSAPSGNAG